ncbi:hypothetical protein D3C72_2066330 [compost metagenome]
MQRYLSWLSELEPAKQQTYRLKQQQVSDTPFSQLLLQDFVASLGVQQALAGVG